MSNIFWKLHFNEPWCFFNGLDDELLNVCTWTLEVFLRQQSLERDVMRVAVDKGGVRTGLDLLWFLWGEWIGSTISDVHLQLQQDLQWALELHLAAGRRRWSWKLNLQRNSSKPSITLQLQLGLWTDRQAYATKGKVHEQKKKFRSVVRPNTLPLQALIFQRI